jgi:hypothetical protein
LVWGPSEWKQIPAELTVQTNWDLK